MKKKGFTLVELLVVIAIIGILATIVIVVTRGARDATRDARIQTQMSQIRSAAEMFYSANGYSYGTAATDNMCEDSDDITSLIDDIEEQGNDVDVTCACNDQIYCVSSTMATDGRDDICISEAGTIAEGFECDEDNTSLTFSECVAI